MDLRITQTYAKIGIQSYPAEMTIRQPRAEVEIQQQPAELIIDRELTRVLIDQSQCFAESGLKSYRMSTQEMADWSREWALESIGRISEEGARLMAIERGGNPIADIAYENSLEQKEVNMVTMPRSRPKIDVQGYLHIDWKQNPPDIRWNVHSRAEIDATRPRVDIYMRQWPSVQIEVIGKQFDQKI